MNNEQQKPDEMRAMADIVRKLEAMDEAARRRVMTYLKDRYDPKPPPHMASEPMAKTSLRST